jgi:hypothetical protein
MCGLRRKVQASDQEDTEKLIAGISTVHKQDKFQIAFAEGRIILTYTLTDLARI